MFLLAFIEKIQRERGADPDALREEFLAAGRKVARDVLGDQPRIETTWNGENGTIEYRQVLLTVETVQHSYREIAVEKLREIGGDFAGIGVGEELELSLLFTSEDEAQARDLDAQFRGLPALSCFQSRLWGPLDEALAEVVHRHLPPKSGQPGTIAHLFQTGSWLTSLRGEKNGIVVTVAGGIWKEKPIRPDLATIQYGVKLRVERNGRSLEVPVHDAADSQAVARWAMRPASQEHGRAIEAELVRIATSLGGEVVVDKLDGAGIVGSILRILLPEPA